MTFTLNNVVPWGRAFAEYHKMFALDDSFASKKLLGCADGPASFNAEAKQRNWNVVSCDPLYDCTPREIRQRIDETYKMVIQGIRENFDDYLWTHFSSPEDLGRARMEAMSKFLADFSGARSGLQYVAGELPDLPFDDEQFDAALVSHFLFLYSHLFDAKFHIASICELLRVASEVRIFPITTLTGSTSPHLVHVVNESRFDCSVTQVPYEFSKNADQMLVIRKNN